MDALSVSPLGPATLSAVSALRPLQTLPAPAQDGNPAGPTLSVGDLARGILQRTLQSATAFPVIEPAAGSLGLAQEATASLLAALVAPQPAASATATPDATTAPVPAVFNATASTPTASTAAPALPAPVPAEVPIVQDAFANASSLEFALQTALRFGAGVAAQAAPALQRLNPGTDLVRDATAVLRTGNLQPHAGGPGPEAFTHPQPPTQRALHSYLGLPAAGEVHLVDVQA
ncbi:MAG: hypothetical protein NDI58_01190 [Geothrix sp.]|nr:hypothetical protein [Geothrix sp.]